MSVRIEEAGRSCPQCKQPLKYFTYIKDDEDSESVTITSCPTCGLVGMTPAQMGQQEMAQSVNLSP